MDCVEVLGLGVNTKYFCTDLIFAHISLIKYLLFMNMKSDFVTILKK
jgi:hypothetical protein